MRTLDRIRLLQLDSVNVAVRAHYMPISTRPWISAQRPSAG